MKKRAKYLDEIYYYHDDETIHTGIVRGVDGDIYYIDSTCFKDAIKISGKDIVYNLTTCINYRKLNNQVK